MNYKKIYIYISVIILEILLYVVGPLKSMSSLVAHKSYDYQLFYLIEFNILFFCFALILHRVNTRQSFIRSLFLGALVGTISSLVSIVLGEGFVKLKWNIFLDIIVHEYNRGNFFVRVLGGYIIEALLVGGWIFGIILFVALRYVEINYMKKIQKIKEENL